MDGITATLDELKDSVEPAIPARDFGGEMRNQIQLEKPNNIGDVEAAEFFVVRNIQEDSRLGQAAEARLRLFSGSIEFAGASLLTGKLSLKLVHKRL